MNFFNRKLNQSVLWFSVFLISVVFTFIYNNLHFNLSRAPDFQFYTDYISYFFRDMESTTREQGLIYFFLVSLTIKMTMFDFGTAGYELVLSNGVLITNYILYIVGLIGLFKLLEFKNFERSNIFFTFALMSFFPQTNNLLLTMKPEMLAFSFLPWSLLSIMIYLEKNNVKYLYLALFSNVLLLSSKATIVGAIGIIYLYILIKHWKNFNNLHIVKFLILGVFFLCAVFYENIIANGKFILEHTNTNLRNQDTANLSILYNINFKELVTNPFRNIHANSLLGIMALDTFGDYFQNYALQDNSVFSYSPKKIPSLWWITHWTQLISISLTIIFYTLVFKYSISHKENRLFFLLPFFGLVILVLQAFGFPQVNFNASMADTFKTHYYSYLLIISFAFVVPSFISKFKKMKGFIFLLGFVLFFNLYGFLKVDTNGYKEVLTMRNNYSVTCNLNNFLMGDFISSNCGSSEIRICKTPTQLVEKNYFISQDVRSLTYNEYIPGQVLQSENKTIVPRTILECSKYVNDQYKLQSYLYNSIKIPYLNSIFFLLSIFSMIYLFFDKKITN